MALTSIVGSILTHVNMSDSPRANIHMTVTIESDEIIMNFGFDVWYLNNLLNVDLI